MLPRANPTRSSLFFRPYPLKYRASIRSDKVELVGVQKEYCHIEQLTNLAALPPSGFKVAVFPLKIKGASAAPARVVAIID